MKRFYTEQKLILGVITINAEEAYHMRTVVRFKCGDECLLVNGQGQTAEAVVIGMDKHAVRLEIKSVTEQEQTGLQLVVLQGYLKDRKLDDLIRPLSELGVSVLCPVFSKRSVPLPETGRMTARLERWRKLAVEAMKQCCRGDLMAVNEPLGFEDALRQYEQCEIKLFFWEEAVLGLHDTIQCALSQSMQMASAAVFLGPEGGFTRDEAELAQAYGFKPVSLGSRILRAQTAALTAAALLQYTLGDLGAGIES